MKPPSTLRLLPAPTQMHLCRLIRFVLLAKPFAPLPRLYFSLSFCSPSPSSRLTPLLSDSQFLSSCVFSPSPPITFSPSLSRSSSPSSVGDPRVQLGGPPAHVRRGQDGGAPLPDSEAAVVQISAGNGPRHLGQKTPRAGAVPAVGLSERESV